MSPIEAPRARFRSGEWTACSDDRTLRRGGEVQRLEPRVAGLLFYLAHRAGQVVPKEELLSAVWSDAAVEEVALARSVSELRRVLGDDARQPRYIETIPKRGYRWIAEVSDASPELPRPAPRRRAWVWGAGVSAALLALVALAGVVGDGGVATGAAGKAGAGAVPVIAVLPFDDLGEPGDGGFAAGITEEITSRLAMASTLRVISRTSANRAALDGGTLPEIGAELGADYVLEGSVRWGGAAGGNRFRVTPQLIRVADDTHVWSASFDRELGESFRVQTELAREVIRQLGVQLRAEESDRLGAPPTRSVEAYQAYLRGLETARRADADLDRVATAVDLFEQAIRLDPGFALAQVELSLLQSSVYHEGLDRSPQRRAAARVAAERALELAPDLPQAHLAMGLVHYRGHRDYPRALAEFEIAEAGLPNSAELPMAIGFILRRQGDVEAALEHFARAADRNPLDPYVHLNIGQTHMMRRRWELADAAVARAVALAPDLMVAYQDRARVRLWLTDDAVSALSVFDAMPGPRWVGAEAYLRWLTGDAPAAIALWERDPGPLWSDARFITSRDLKLGDAWASLGEEAKARRHYERARSLLEAELRARPDDHRIPGELGLAYAALGQREPALRHGRRAVELLPVSSDAFDGPAYVADLARIHALLGDTEAALEQLEYLMSIPAGNWMTRGWMRRDPRFASLRGHPAFDRLAGLAPPPAS